MLDFAIASLATWRVAALLVREEGPFDLIARLRRALAGHVAGRALECVHCTSLWIAAPAAWWLTGLSTRWPLVWLAVAGAAGLMERVTESRAGEQPLDLEEAAARFKPARS